MGCQIFKVMRYSVPQHEQSNLITAWDLGPTLYSQKLFTDMCSKMNFQACKTEHI